VGGLFVEVEEGGEVGDAVEVAEPFYDDLLARELEGGVYLVVVVYVEVGCVVQHTFRLQVAHHPIIVILHHFEIFLQHLHVSSQLAHFQEEVRLVLELEVGALRLAALGLKHRIVSITNQTQHTNIAYSPISPTNPSLCS